MSVVEYIGIKLYITLTHYCLNVYKRYIPFLLYLPPSSGNSGYRIIILLKISTIFCLIDFLFIVCYQISFCHYFCMCIVLYIFTCVPVSMRACVCVCAGAHTHVCTAYVAHPDFINGYFPQLLSVLRQSLSLTLELTDSAWLAGQQVQGITGTTGSHHGLWGFIIRYLYLYSKHPRLTTAPSLLIVLFLSSSHLGFNLLLFI